MASEHSSFEWDAGKAKSNLADHRVAFTDAARVLADRFADAFHVENFDDQHCTADEDRWITIGSEPEDRNIVLFVVWTRVQGATRIISARAVTKRERREYEGELASRIGG